MKRGKYNTTPKVTPPAEVDEIKRVNREKLDYIMAQGPDYIITLAIKYYGENWMTVFGGEKSYLHNERAKHHQKKGGVRGVKGNRERPVLKLDIDTEEIVQSYDTVYQCAEEEGFTHTQMTTLIATLTGRYNQYKGYKWKFADEKKIVIYGEEL